MSSSLELRNAIRLVSRKRGEEAVKLAQWVAVQLELSCVGGWRGMNLILAIP